MCKCKCGGGGGRERGSERERERFHLSLYMQEYDDESPGDESPTINGSGTPTDSTALPSTPHFSPLCTYESETYSQYTQTHTHTLTHKAHTLTNAHHMLAEKKKNRRLLNTYIAHYLAVINKHDLFSFHHYPFLLRQRDNYA